MNHLTITGLLATHQFGGSIQGGLKDIAYDIAYGIDDEDDEDDEEIGELVEDPKALVYDDEDFAVDDQQLAYSKLDSTDTPNQPTPDVQHPTPTPIRLKLTCKVMYILPLYWYKAR